MDGSWMVTDDVITLGTVGVIFTSLFPHEQCTKQSMSSNTALSKSRSE